MNECIPSFDEAYCRYRRRIRNLCFRMTRSADDAEDFTQEVFLQLHRKIHTFQGDSQFYTWFHRLAVNVVLMQLRKKRAVTVSLDEMAEGFLEDGNGAYYNAILRNDDALELSPDRLVIMRAIDSLPHGYRTVLILHDIEDLEHHEIADILDCSIGNAKSQLYKARTMITGILQGTKKNRIERSLDDAFTDIAKYLEEPNGRTDADRV